MRICGKTCPLGAGYQIISVRCVRIPPDPERSKETYTQKASLPNTDSPNLAKSLYSNIGNQVLLCLRFQQPTPQYLREIQEIFQRGAETSCL